MLGKKGAEIRPEDAWSILPSSLVHARFPTQVRPPIPAVQVLGKKDVEIGPKDKVSPTQFATVWASLGVSISRGYVDGFFNKYGQDVRGMMPVTVGMRHKTRRCWG